MSTLLEVVKLDFYRSNWKEKAGEAEVGTDWTRCGVLQTRILEIQALRWILAEITVALQCGHMRCYIELHVRYPNYSTILGYLLEDILLTTGCQSVAAERILFQLPRSTEDGTRMSSSLLEQSSHRQCVASHPHIRTPITDPSS